MVGAKKDCATAIMLLDLHAKHLGELKRVEQVRQQLASKLQTERDRLDSSHRLEFSIKKDLVGLVVGKGGKTIQEAKATTGVDRVDVFGSDSEPRVVITASSREKAGRAASCSSTRASASPSRRTRSAGSSAPAASRSARCRRRRR